MASVIIEKLHLTGGSPIFALTVAGCTFRYFFVGCRRARVRALNEKTVMNNMRSDQKTAIRMAGEKKRRWANREKKLLWLLVFSLITSFCLGMLNGRRELGVWEIFLPLLIIINYVVYYLWSDSQVRRYEAEHLALGYYANDRKDIPDEQLLRYTRLKNSYVMEVLRNTVLIAVLCGGLVLAGQQLARGSFTSLWLPLVVLLLFGLIRVIQYQRHQISRFGKNGTHIMSR